MVAVADVEDLRAAILEGGDEYLVVGIVMPTKERWAELYNADSPRQAEDLARANVSSKVVDGKHGELWVAGVVMLDTSGHLLVADTYAHFVDPDEGVL